MNRAGHCANCARIVYKTPGWPCTCGITGIELYNLLYVKPKAKRVGRYTGFTNKTKKAIITLTADSKAIELFAAEAE